MDQEEESNNNNRGEKYSKKELRQDRKRKKLIAEFNLSKTNDEMKRPGELLDGSNVKKLRVDPGEGKKLSPAEFKELKKLLAERKKVLKQLPRFTLQGAGSIACLSNEQNVREPIFMSDVQHLLLYALGGNTIIQPPNRWCSMQKANRLTHIVALIIEGISSQDFFSYEHLFPNLTKHFSDRVEVMAPIYYGSEVTEELSCVPLSNAQKDAILKNYGTLEAAMTAKEVVKVYRALFPIRVEEIPEPIPERKEIPASDVFPRTYLLLGINQMIVEGYPMPWMHINSKFSDFVFSKPNYKEVDDHSPMFAIDCEMCITVTEPNALTKIAVINENLEVIYETFVKPKDEVTNYLTRFSGITEESLKGVTTTLEDVQKALSELLPENAILIGQSLNCDLLALKLMHPYVIDTSVIFNLSGISGRKSKLKHLAEVFLQKAIQVGKQGHCPVEDATAAMKLVKLKLSNGFLFGDNVASTDEPAVPERVLTSSIFNRAYRSKKTVAVVGPDHVLKKYESVSLTPPTGTAFTSVPTTNNKESVSKLTEIATSHQLTIAHLDVSKKLEESANKKEKALVKLDNWCDKIYNHVSINGMCIVVFSGPKKIIVEPQESSFEPPSPSNSSSPSNEQTSNKSNEIQPKKVSRQNGVCFVRVNVKGV